MTNNSYFNVFINYPNFTIIESASKQKKCHNALNTLKQIDKVLRENLKYRSTFPADNALHWMKGSGCISYLQKKATQIRDGYDQKQSRLCWIWRKIFSRKKEVEAVYKRITDFTSRTDLALKATAYKLGCKDDDIHLAKKYLEDLRTNLKFLSKQDWKYGREESKSLFCHLIKRDSRGKILIEESINRLRTLPIDDLVILFANDAPPLMPLRRAILTPQISTGRASKNAPMASLALRYAIKNKELKVVRFLLNHRADPNVCTQDGATALHWAAMYGSPAMVNLLIKYGADPNACTETGATALHAAAVHGTPAMVNLLIKHGADPNACTQKGTTVLHSAAEYGSPEIISLLLEYGVDPDARDQKGVTALHLAAEHDTPERIKLLLEHEADTNVCTETGATALHLAAVNGAPENVKLLLEHGADPNARNQDGETPLQIATRCNFLPISSLLREYGANEAVLNNP
ncbi:MAG: ankyrin repeat domain-containing protein [Parachlamydiaceae bacterium]